jgi:hypothetical protein
MENELMKTILITAGPVHEHLDDVKIITNKFKGGRIAALAERIISNSVTELPEEQVLKVIRFAMLRLYKLGHYDIPYVENVEIFKNVFELCKYKVIFLCAKGTKEPDIPQSTLKRELIEIVYHNGFNDYYDKVKKYSKEVDAVILGAAVCNLIPAEPIKGKFPSHNYKPNDIVPINFKIAPRVVDMVKKEAPKVHLFAFKLLSGVEHEELIDAAYDICLESKATAVIANDLTNLDDKYIVTKEKGVLPYKEENYHEFILNCIESEFYKTVITKEPQFDESKFYKTVITKSDMMTEFLQNPNLYVRVCTLISQFSHLFMKRYGKEQYVFGTIAVIDRDDNSIITSVRGKKDLDKFVRCFVDNKSGIVFANEKVTLNAPLLDHIFQTFKDATAIVHYHDFDKDLPELPYQLPGTNKDSIRDLTGCEEGFVIKGHGTFLILRD